MRVETLSPILNVSSLSATFAWFEQLGLRKSFEWGSPATFGGVCCGAFEILLAEGAQGGRGKTALTQTSGTQGADNAEKGMWLMLIIDDVDAVHATCLAQGIEVTRLPTDEPWGIREMHVRHPDGHVLRMGQRLAPP